MSDVWLKVSQFLGSLNGENINRESYVRTPEYVKALEAWKETEQEWEAFLKLYLKDSGKSGRNEGVPGGLCIRPGEACLYPRIRRLRTGAVPYGNSEREW